MKLKWILLPALIVFISFFLASYPFHPVRAGSSDCDFYVAIDGDDNNAGTDITQPFETIQKGLQAVSAGETVCVRGGSYINTNARKVNIDKSGQPNNPITIKGYQDEKPRLDGQYRYPKHDPSSSHECTGNKSKGDGQDPDTRYMNYSSLVKITGSWINFEGFDINGSTGRGIYIEDAHHITIENSKIYSNRGGGIRAMEGIQGNGEVHHITIQDNEIYDNTNYCTYKRGSDAGMPWPGTISLSHAHHSIIKGNKVYQNYGQGLHPVELEHILIEDNQVWDNDGAQLHIDCIAYPIVQRNLIYKTPGGMGMMGINVSVDNRYGNEASDPVMKEQVIVNNILIGNVINLDFHEKDDKKKGALIDAVIANNTFINAKITDTNGIFNIRLLDPDETSENHQNVKFENNIIIQDENPENMFKGPSRNKDVFTWNHNIWSTAPPDFARGTDDIILDEQGIDPETILNNYRARLIPGQTDPNWFGLKPGSPAINRGRVFANGELPNHVFDTLGSNPLTIDYFFNPRDSQPDIGAHEYGGASSPTDPPTGTTLTFNFKPEGMVTPPSLLGTKVTAIKDGQGTPQAITASYLTDGEYEGEISGLDPGTYTIIVKPERHLSEKFEGISITEGNNEYDFTKTQYGARFLAGDISGADGSPNNKVDVYDISLAVSDFDEEGDAADLTADVDYDGIVGGLDLTYIISSFDEEGE